MKDTLELTGVCWFEDIGFGDINLCYIEHACDHYSSDIETTIELDKAAAENIIGWLQDKFNLKPNADLTGNQKPVKEVTNV